MESVKVEALVTVSNPAFGNQPLEFIMLPSIAVVDGHWQDEAAIAKTLRKMADEIESGASFMGCMVNRPDRGVEHEPLVIA